MLDYISLDSTQKTTSNQPLSPNEKVVPRIIKIERIAKELVDETHPLVIQLVEAGYRVKQSIDAIAKYRTLEAAMDHMVDTSDSEEEDDDDEPELIPSAKKQFSRLDSVADFEMNW